MRVSGVLALMVVLVGCSREPIPPCHFAGTALPGPSAGCLVVQDDSILLVQVLGGKYGPPGGVVEEGESAQCAAERETWDETGIEVTAGPQFRQFPNGFRLFWCEPITPGATPEVLDPLEIRSAGYFRAEDLAGLEWRFPEQVALLLDAMAQGAPQS